MFAAAVLAVAVALSPARVQQYLDAHPPKTTLHLVGMQEAPEALALLRHGILAGAPNDCVPLTLTDAGRRKAAGLGWKSESQYLMIPLGRFMLVRGSLRISHAMGAPAAEFFVALRLNRSGDFAKQISQDWTVDALGENGGVTLAYSGKHIFIRIPLTASGSLYEFSIERVYHLCSVNAVPQLKARSTQKL